MTNISHAVQLFIKAIRQQNRINMYYDSMTDGEELYREVDPWYLYKKNSTYYLTGFCHAQLDERTFHLKRILDFKITDKHFTRTPLPLSMIRKRKESLTDFFVNIDKFTFHAFPAETEIDLRALGVKFKSEEIKKQHEKSMAQNGYPITIKLSKMHQLAKCRSPLEHKVLLDLNNNQFVKEISVEPINIQYFYRKVSYIYIPDVLVTYNDGSKDLIEIKLSGDIGQTKNQAKFDAAEKYAQENQYRFYIIGTIGNSHSPVRRQKWVLDEVHTSIFHHKNIDEYFAHPFLNCQNKKIKSPSRETKDVTKPIKHNRFNRSRLFFYCRNRKTRQRLYTRKMGSVRKNTFCRCVICKRRIYIRGSMIIKTRFISRNTQRLGNRYRTSQL